MPERANPLLIITKPKARMTRALTFIILAVNLPPISDVALPSPISSGAVPRLKKNMDAAPSRALPVPRAYICIPCKGPQGISPFKSPTTKGLFPLPNFIEKLRNGAGILGIHLRIAGAIPNKLIAMIIMNTPEAMATAPLAQPEKLTAEPRAPTRPPMMVYEITRPPLYKRLVRRVVNPVFCFPGNALWVSAAATH